MNDLATNLFREGKIDKQVFDTYILFESTELGRDFLKRMLEAIVLEEPPLHGEGTAYAWQDGRRSVWRDIKNAINYVNEKMTESKEHDDRDYEHRAKHYNRDYGK